MPSTELSVEQCRVLARLRRYRPDAELALHDTAHGLVIEIRSGRRAGLARLERSGRLVRDEPLIPAPAQPRAAGARDIAAPLAVDDGPLAA